MSPKNHRSKWPWIAAVVFIVVAGLTVFTSGQQGPEGGRLLGSKDSLYVPILAFGPEGPEELRGMPDDWSHHHLVFSDPGTEEEAIRNGGHEEWLRIVNEHRYVMQQLKQRRPARGPAAEDVSRIEEMARAGETAGGQQTSESLSPAEAEEEPSGLSELWRPRLPQPPKPRGNRITKDWSVALGGSLAAGQYPAKYSYSTTSASCSDYVVFPTGAAGSSTQATIVAFNNIYVGTGGCAASSPTVYWAYNTGGTANLSPVVSGDGTQVAFIQTSSSVASLVILKMAASGGSVSSPTFGSGAGSVAAASYRACTAPCYTAITLSGSPNDTNSAPFYVYGTPDTLYVGDNSGKLHQFTGVFLGTPAETTTNGWPATASTETSPILTSPVFDTGTSALVFVGDASGYLHSVTTTGTTRTVATSNQLVCGTGGLVDPPIVDPTTENVYAFVGDGCDATPGNSYVNRFAAGTSISGSYGPNYASLGNRGTNNTSTIQRAGTFDNQYFTGTGNTGNLYVCVNGRVYQITMATLSGTGTPTVNTFNTPVSTVSSASTCSPVTEFLGVTASTTINEAGGITATATSVTVTSGTGIANNDYIQIDSEIMRVTAGGGTTTLTITRGQLGTTAAAHANGAAVQDIKDWLFLSVVANGNVASCTGACLYNYNVIGAGTTGTPTAGLAATGGTSGIVVDNQSTTQVGAEQIYFSTLGGDTAVQASQSNP